MRHFRSSKNLSLCFYHFYARFSNGYQENTVHVWNSMVETILKSLALAEGDLNAFLLMGNHFHGVVRIKPLHRNLWRDSLADLCPISIEEKRINMLLIENHSALLKTLQYIYRNPVEAGLVGLALEFPFSTYREIMKPNANPELAKLEIIYDPLDLIHRTNLGFDRGFDRG